LIHISKKGSSKSIATHTENIGAGGICVIIKENLGLFQGVNIELYLNNGNDAIKCAGTVVWVVKKRPERKEKDYLFDTGIEFVDIDEKQRQRITEIVDEILKKQPSQT
jgi:Tfp pilus assembly protein PilZ